MLQVKKTMSSLTDLGDKVSKRKRKLRERTSQLSSRLEKLRKLTSDLREKETHDLSEMAEKEEALREREAKDKQEEKDLQRVNFNRQLIQYHSFLKKVVVKAGKN